MKTVIHMIATLGIIGILSGGLLSWISGWASPIIEENAIRETEKAIFIVNPAGRSYEKIDAADIELYKVLDENKNVIGFSLAHAGNGFQGRIRMMIGMSPDLEKITLIEILEQVETPGLGTKVTENNFRDQFRGLDTSPLVEWVKGAAPSKPNEIQAVTGATISSKSVVAIINDGISKAKRLRREGRL